MGIFDFFLSGRNAEILRHENEGKIHLGQDNRSFSLNIRGIRDIRGNTVKRPIKGGQFPYYFVIRYKKKHLLRGCYVFSGMLDDSSLKGFVAQYEVKESLENTREVLIDFEYKLQSFKKEQPKFYFILEDYGRFDEKYLRI